MRSVSQLISSATALTLLALGVSCVTKGSRSEGSKCEQTSECSGDLECVEDRCTITARTVEKMAQQSGVEARPERPLAPAQVGAGAIKVRRAKGFGVALAFCADNERLVGGFCSPGGGPNRRTEQAIIGESENDTLGAQWKCSRFDMTVTATALCQRTSQGTRQE